MIWLLCIVQVNCVISNKHATKIFWQGSHYLVSNFENCEVRFKTLILVNVSCHQVNLKRKYSITRITKDKTELILS